MSSNSNKKKRNKTEKEDRKNVEITAMKVTSVKMRYQI